MPDGRTDISIDERLNRSDAMNQTASDQGESKQSERNAGHSSFKIVTCVVVLLVSVVYAAALIRSNWISGDDGLLAANAVRVINGELPHRDFVDNYTGGLDYIHAAAFRAFGVNLVSMRIAVLCVFAIWVPVVFYLASEFAPPIVAGAFTLLAVAWSLPNYPTPMPSWYNLFFATFGAAAVFRYLKTHQKRWLFIAGFFGGASFLIKVIGLYYIAALLLFLVFREQSIHLSENTGAKTASLLYRIFVGVSLSFFVSAILLLVHPNGSSGRIVHLIVPVLAITAVPVLRERVDSFAGSRERFASLFAMINPFAIGVLMPIGIFLIPYLVTGSVRMFLEGVFPASVARANSLAVFDPPPAICFMFTVPPLLALAVAYDAKPRAARIAGAATAIIGVILIVIAGRYPLTTQLTFQSAQMLAPVFLLIGVAQLIPAKKLGEMREQQLMLLLSLAALCGLVQYPFAAPIYFCYYAPLLILAILAVSSNWPRPANSSMAAAIIGFYILFAVVRFALPASLHRGFLPSPPTAPLMLDRAGNIRVVTPATTTGMVAAVRQHSNDGKVLAFPECPEVYFLTGRRNTTRNDVGVAPQDIERVIANKEVNVIVINQKPFFPDSRPDRATLADIERAYPNSTVSGKYLIRWRE